MGDTGSEQGESGGRDAEGDKKAIPDRTFGEEGTNKTQPTPDPNARPSDVGAGGKFMEPTPFTR